MKVHVVEYGWDDKFEHDHKCTKVEEYMIDGQLGFRIMDGKHELTDGPLDDIISWAVI